MPLNKETNKLFQASTEKFSAPLRKERFTAMNLIYYNIYIYIYMCVCVCACVPGDECKLHALVDSYL